MKIAQICPRYSPDIGGVETHVKEISERLVRAGHDVEVITTDPTGRLSKRETINGVKVIRFRSFAPGNAYYFAPQIYYYLKNITMMLFTHTAIMLFPLFSHPWASMEGNSYLRRIITGAVILHSGIYYINLTSFLES